MKNLKFYRNFLTFVLVIVKISLLSSQNENTNITADFKELTGIVIDHNSKTPLVFVDIVVKSTNISTVTNSNGEFLLKIPHTLLAGDIIISHLGYEKAEIKIAVLKSDQKIELLPAIIKLNAVSINTTNKSAEEIVKETLKKRSSIYNNNKTVMTAFYRETIKKRKKNASLSEAVVRIHKQPYNNLKEDDIELIRARKNTNYAKLDTLALKLQGGPHSNLYVDIIKYPEFIFTKEDMAFYNFSFDNATKISDNEIHVINFKQKGHNGVPLFYGTLFIDAKTLALKSAVYSLDVSNRALSSLIYIRKKPTNAEVYPTNTSYIVNYRTTNGKWHYAYSNISLTFKVNWKNKLFNSSYTLNSEMAITDWDIQNNEAVKVRRKLIQPTTILSEKALGFSDPRFWGSYNIIEPEKSIKSAIKKIQKQLKRT